MKETKPVKLRLTSLIALTTLLALLAQGCSRPLSPEESCNFVQNPEKQRVSWGRNVPVKLYVHESVPNSAYDAIDRSVNEYNLKLGGGREVFRIVARGVGGAVDPKRDGYSMIYWFDKWADSRTEQARTTIYWTGTEIFEADIRINADSFRYSLGENTNSTEVDFVSLMVHEFGHVLGLGHVVTAGSVMNLSLDQGQDRRKLNDSDLASLKCEY